MSFDFAKTRFLEQKTITVKDPDTVVPQKVIPGHDEIRRVAHTRKTYGIDPSKKMSDYSFSNDSYYDTYDVGGLAFSKPLAKGASIDGIALRVKGTNIELSLGETGTNTNFPAHTVQNLTNGVDISHMSLPEIMNTLKTNNPTNWTAYLNSKGLPANAKMEDVITRAIQDGDLWGQHELSGWRHFDLKNLLEKTVTEYSDEVVHIPDQIIPGKIIPGATRTVTTKAFSARAAAMSAFRGAAPGIGVAVGETLHNRGENTNGERHNKPGQVISGRRSGRFEENNRLLNDDKYIEDDDLIQ